MGQIARMIADYRSPTAKKAAAAADDDDDESEDE